MNNMFEIATKNKFRFPYKGSVTVEDLWDLSLEQLDSIFKVLNKKAKDSQEESLLSTKSNEDKMLDTQIEIVKYIVNIKKNEIAERLLEKERKEKNQRIMEIIADKEDKALHEMSIEDLRKMIQ